jgi:hypothetical protein
LTVAQNTLPFWFAPTIGFEEVFTKALQSIWSSTLLKFLGFFFLEAFELGVSAAEAWEVGVHRAVEEVERLLSTLGLLLLLLLLDVFVDIERKLDVAMGIFYEGTTGSECDPNCDPLGNFGSQPTILDNKILILCLN